MYDIPRTSSGHLLDGCPAIDELGQHFEQVMESTKSGGKSGGISAAFIPFPLVAGRNWSDIDELNCSDGILRSDAVSIATGT